jgi:type IV secretory pathway VirB6-like protein
MQSFRQLSGKDYYKEVRSLLFTLYFIAWNYEVVGSRRT